MSKTEYYIGDCLQNIRLKTWKAGYSLKCEKRTLVATPFVALNFKFDLANFCSDCSKQKEVGDRGKGT